MALVSMRRRYLCYPVIEWVHLARRVGSLDREGYMDVRRFFFQVSDNRQTWDMRSAREWNVIKVCVSNLPMRQDDLHIHNPPQDHLGFIRVRRQIYQMSNQGRHLGAINATLREHPADNRILVAVRDITTGDNHVVEEKSRVRAVLAGVGYLFLRQGRM